jgi:hypothetical protein
VVDTGAALTATMRRTPVACIASTIRGVPLAVTPTSLLDLGVDLAEQRVVVGRFITACTNGDIEGLLAVLAPDVQGSVDLGPADRRSGVVVCGAQPVARNLFRYFGSWTTLVGVPAVAAVGDVRRWGYLSRGAT